MNKEKIAEFAQRTGTAIISSELYKKPGRLNKYLESAFTALIDQEEAEEETERRLVVHSYEDSEEIARKLKEYLTASIGYFNSPEEGNDPIRPNHYKGRFHGIEVKDVIDDFTRGNYNVSTAVVYLLRAGKKSGNPTVQDIKKAVTHLQFEIDFLTRVNPEDHV
jgi:hypothetical protein